MKIIKVPSIGEENIRTDYYINVDSIASIHDYGESNSCVVTLNNGRSIFMLE